MSVFHIWLLLLLSLTTVCSVRADRTHPDGSPLIHKLADSLKQTARVAVKVKAGESAQQIADAHNYVNHGPLFESGDVYIFEEKRKKPEASPHPHISSNEHVEWYETQIRRHRAKRQLSPEDPLYAQQWHLHSTPTTQAHINVEPVWRSGITGAGVHIAIIDDGLFVEHPDIHPNYDAAGSYDFNYDDSDPTPFSYDYHGTAAAGVAAAASNSYCGVGVAPRAALSAIRLLADMNTDEQEARALSYMPQRNDIYSNSWGPADDGARLEGPRTLTTEALRQGAAYGRSGRGSIFVWAAGNGGLKQDNCNYDGYANSRYTISIGALDSHSQQPVYSEQCAALIAVCPSSAGSSSSKQPQISSTGFPPDGCYKRFGGTSAAAPMAAGIAALILEINEELSWRDVQAILIECARPIQTSDVSSGWSVNGAGYSHSHRFGFGLLDAGRAAELAAEWTLLPECVSARVTIAEGGSPLDSTLFFVFRDHFIVEHVTLALNVVLSSGSRGALKIVLHSPSGSSSLLQDYHSDSATTINWSYMSVRHWGESSDSGDGKWSLQLLVSPQSEVSISGTVRSATLTLYGHVE